jgi:HEAT repeat protein
MRIHRWLLTTLTLLLTIPVAPAGEVSSLGDERTLQAVGLTTDGASLVSFFRTRGKSEADGEHLRGLVKKLGDESSVVRERSAAELVAWGPLAVPALRQAANDLEGEATTGRARRCLFAIEGPDSASLPAAAARLIAARKPAGAAEALLSYLPYADTPAVLQEVRTALCAVAYTDGKAEEVLVRALKDPVSVRRAAAGAALYRVDQPEQWPAVRKLLQDPKPAVRMRAALSLAAARDPEAVAVLIDLLADLAPEQRKEAEDILHEMAGEWAPGPVVGEDDIARRIRRDGWAAWWKNADGPALLAMLRKHTLTPADQEKARGLIKKLGDDNFDDRERAQADLVAMGKLTLPQLREATKDKDPEIARRSEECIQRIEKDPANVLPTAALRMLAVRRPEGAAEALLAYLPHADTETLVAEVQSALNVVATRDGKVEQVVLKALDDKLALRRGAAAEALAVVGGAEHRATVRKLLQDPDKMVKLRVALAMTNARDKEGVPALIELLAELPAEQVWQAQELLFVLAGDAPPETTPGADEDSRKKNRDAWADWWKTNGAKVDFAKLDPARRWLNFTLYVDHGQNRVVELGPDNKPRWKIENLTNPIDAVILPGNRVLIAEYSGNKVTERDFNGKILWEKANLPGSPCNVQRLPNGNTFIATTGGIIEVDRAGKEVYTINTLPGVLAANKMRDGNIWALINDGRIMKIDSTGKELKSIQTGQAMPAGGIDVLPNGGVLVAQQNTNKVLEYDADGKLVWEAGAPQAVSATRLPNGNVLAASYGQARIFEIDRKGNVVWEHKDNMNPFRARRR